MGGLDFRGVEFWLALCSWYSNSECMETSLIMERVSFLFHQVCSLIMALFVYYTRNASNVGVYMTIFDHCSLVV